MEHIGVVNKQKWIAKPKDTNKAAYNSTEIHNLNIKPLRAYYNYSLIQK